MTGFLGEIQFWRWQISGSACWVLFLELLPTSKIHQTNTPTHPARNPHPNSLPLNNLITPVQASPLSTFVHSSFCINLSQINLGAGPSPIQLNLSTHSHTRCRFKESHQASNWSQKTLTLSLFKFLETETQHLALPHTLLGDIWLRIQSQNSSENPLMEQKKDRLRPSINCTHLTVQAHLLAEGLWH